MTPRTLAWIAQATGGTLVGHDRMVDAVATDTRNLHAHDATLFVALKGEHHDGHAHVRAAVMGGCVAALVEREPDVDVPHVRVADTQRALGDFAAAVQRTRATRVLAITGSNGKTSVKALLLSILQQLGGAYANPGNRNNEIGLPLAVLDAPDDARFAVYEMGAGKPGDIAYLTAIAPPHVALVNNIAPAHLERMGSVEGVARTKGAIYQALPADGVAVVNLDDAFAGYFLELVQGRRVVGYALDADAPFTALDLQADAEGTRFRLCTPDGAIDVALPLPGRHNVRNALAAAAMAMAVGAGLAQVRDGLQGVQPVAGRLQMHRLHAGAVLVDDSYNANPGSVDAAIDTLAGSGGEAWLVLGDMRELGLDEVALHARAGSRAKAAGITRLYALGPLSAHAAQAFGVGGRAFASHAELADVLAADIEARALVGAASAASSSAVMDRLAAEAAPAGSEALRIVVKGSRGSAMDRVVDALLQRDAANANAGGTHAA